MKRLIVIGAGGHGRVIADIAKKNGYTDIVFLDNDDSKKICGEYPVIGKTSDAVMYPSANFIVAIGNATHRERVYRELIKHNLRIVTLTHPNAVIGENCVIGIGTVVMAGAVINSGTTIGKCCIINTCASVDHDCIIGDFVHVSVGAHVAGTVLVGSRSWLAVGSSVINNITITKDCMVGAGAVVVEDLLESGTYVGIPARRKK